MASKTKKRISITADHDVENALHFLATRDRVPVTTKATELLRTIIELEEDFTLTSLAESRSRTKAKYIPHEKVWK
jgi:hypothetical protein